MGKGYTFSVTYPVTINHGHTWTLNRWRGDEMTSRARAALLKVRLLQRLQSGCIRGRPAPKLQQSQLLSLKC